MEGSVIVTSLKCTQPAPQLLQKSEGIASFVVSCRVLPVDDVALRYADTFRVGVGSAFASGTINGIDGGTNSMLTRKIPKNTVKLFFIVILYLSPR